jgi:hypothetical protein
MLQARMDNASKFFEMMETKLKKIFNLPPTENLQSAYMNMSSLYAHNLSPFFDEEDAEWGVIHEPEYRYEGEIIDGKKHGTGTIYYLDGRS